MILTQHCRRYQAWWPSHPVQILLLSCLMDCSNGEKLLSYCRLRMGNRFLALPGAHTQQYLKPAKFTEDDRLGRAIISPHVYTSTGFVVCNIHCVGEMYVLALFYLPFDWFAAGRWFKYCISSPAHLKAYKRLPGMLTC